MASPDWLRFPPLSSLRDFEANACYGGFNAAARHLNVTHAAVAQQVRSLETHLGLPMVRRDGRALNRTAEGEALALPLAKGFS